METKFYRKVRNLFGKCCFIFPLRKVSYFLHFSLFIKSTKVFIKSILYKSIYFRNYYPCKNNNYDFEKNLERTFFNVSRFTDLIFLIIAIRSLRKKFINMFSLHICSSLHFRDNTIHWENFIRM